MRNRTGDNRMMKRGDRHENIYESLTRKPGRTDQERRDRTRDGMGRCRADPGGTTACALILRGSHRWLPAGIWIETKLTHPGDLREARRGPVGSGAGRSACRSQHGAQGAGRTETGGIGASPWHTSPIPSSWRSSVLRSGMRRRKFWSGATAGPWRWTTMGRWSWTAMSRCKLWRPG